MDWNLIVAAASAEPSSVASFIAWLGSFAWTIFSVAAGLGFVIFVHELGHFLVAKACGVKCDKFYIGFDVPISIFGFQLPSKICHFTYGETEYGIGILPLGGYVKMLGQDDDPRNTEAEIERSKVVKEGTAAEGRKSGANVEKTEGNAILDPRSYLAKPIPARMAIISAGVIMNVIFAVILAAVAYRMGVPYLPAVIGNTVVGSPAWQAGWQPGDQVLRIGKHREPNEKLRFRDDLTKHVIFNGYDRDLDVELKHLDGTTEWSTIRPRKSDVTGKASLGILSIPGLYLAKPDRLEMKTSVELHDKDKLVAVDGTPVANWIDVSSILASKFDQPLEFVFERQSKPQEKGKEQAPPEKIVATIEPQLRQTIGVVIRGNEVGAVRRNSAAEKAGIKVKDLIISVAGEPIGDPLSLGQRLAKLGTQEVTVVVSRPGDKGAAEQELKVTLDRASTFHDSGYFNNELVGVESLGIGLVTTLEISSVTEGGPAATAGVRAGDVLVSGILVNEDKGLEKLDRGRAGDKPIIFDTEKGIMWQQFMALVERCHPTTKIKLTYKRGNETQTAEISTAKSADFYAEARGLLMLSLEDIRIAQTNGEAFQLGFRETFERLEEVLTTLSHLGTGRIKVTDLSGPVGILTMAGNTANIGISSLLVFLTLLSANLAIINFLPIPALDGGHMVFLTYEWIMGKPVDPNMQVKLTIASLLCLLSLMLLATVMDVQRLIEIFM